MVDARENVQMEVVDGKLVITIQLNDVQTYETEKSVVYATTAGNRPVKGRPEYTIGLTMYKSKKHSK